MKDTKVMNHGHIDKFNECRIFLTLWGYMTDAESAKVKERFIKSAKKAGVDVGTVSILDEQ